MAGDNIDRLNSLTDLEITVLHILFEDPEFKVEDAAKDLVISEPHFRTQLTSIFKKLEVPAHIDFRKKRQWIFDKYGSAYETVFMGAEQPKEEIKRVESPIKRAENKPEIYVKPPDPILIKPESTPTPVKTTINEHPKPPRRSVRRWIFDEIPSFIIQALATAGALAIIYLISDAIRNLK